MILNRFLQLSLLACSAYAQTFVGNLAGIATDASSALLPSAVVKLESESTGLTRAEFSSAKGEYLFVDVPGGVYTLTVSAAGFETKKIDTIEIAISKTTNLNVQVDVAQTQSTVEVSASS